MRMDFWFNSFPQTIDFSNVIVQNGFVIFRKELLIARKKRDCMYLYSSKSCALRIIESRRVAWFIEPISYGLCK